MIHGQQNIKFIYSFVYKQQQFSEYSGFVPIAAKSAYMFARFFVS
jgi:hypothetical protein